MISLSPWHSWFGILFKKKKIFHNSKAYLNLLSDFLTHSFIYIYTYIHTHTHTHIYIPTHTHTLFFLVLLGLHLRHMEVFRQGVKSELQLSAYTTAIATPDLGHICNLHHRNTRSLTHWWGQDWTNILMDTSRVCYHWATMGTPVFNIFWKN